MTTTGKHRQNTATVEVREGYEIFHPKQTLKGFARRVTAGGETVAPDDELVMRAEAALAELSDEFDTWMADEVERLRAARQAARSARWSTKTVDALYGVSHDLRGQATTLGYPLVGRIADALCRLLEGFADSSTAPSGLIEQHVDAMIACVRENRRDDSDAVGLAVIEALSASVDAALAEIEAPTLAP